MHPFLFQVNRGILAHTINGMVGKYGLLWFLLSAPFWVSGQQRQLLNGTSWAGTHSPLTKGTEIYFEGDTLYIIDLEGIKPPDSYLFVQKGDTVSLHILDEFSIDCREELPGKYKISWANNGEKLLFKPIQDPCLQRFTRLISESPWFRKRENPLLRYDWYFLDPDKDKVPGISLYETYKWLKFRKSTPITVALIGGQVDAAHEDLKDVISPQTPGAEPNDVSTQMAGIIGARRGNGIGIEGIADNVKILNKVATTAEEVISGLRSAAAHGCKLMVITILQSDILINPKVLAAVSALDKLGILVVSPAPANVSGARPILPPNLLWVYNSELVPPKNEAGVLAPGRNIISTTLNNLYQNTDGIHASCAIVSGSAALLWSYFPKLSGWQIRQILAKSGNSNPLYPGLINTWKAYDLSSKAAKAKVK